MNENSVNLEKLAKQEQHAYMKKWREKNKDKVKASNKRYWEKKAIKKLQEKA